MRLNLRALIKTTILLILVLHSPSLRLFIDILVNAHIILHLVLSWLCSVITAYLPSIVDITKDAYSFIQPYVTLAKSTMIYILHHTGALTISTLTTWITESPRYLCMVNRWLVEVGEGVVEWALSEEVGQVAKGWTLAKQEVARYCGFVL